VTSTDPAKSLPMGVQKSYFMLSRSARAVLDTALQNFRSIAPERATTLSGSAVSRSLNRQSGL
jgi:hypothetical protein